MIQPKGKTLMTNAEKEMIIALREKRYSLKQIAGFVQRSISSVKRVLYAVR
jgi:IS30 family transposase